MAIIWPCPLLVADYVAQGRAVPVPRQRCPSCSGRLGFWHGYWRHVRGGGGHELRLWIRRGRCRACDRTHALLPSFLLRGRLDEVATIGAALLRGVHGAGQRTIAAGLQRPHTTVRDWRRRHRARAPGLAAGFAAWVVALGGVPPALRGDPEGNALAALGAVWVRARRNFGDGVGEPWQLASVITGGEWLGTNTTSLWPGVDVSGLMRSS